MSKDKGSTTEESRHGPIDGPETGKPPETVVERALQEPRPGTTLKRATPFVVRGPTGQSVNDNRVVLRIYPASANGEGSSFKEFDHQVSKNPFEFSVSFNGAKGNYHFYYRYFNGNKWSYWYLSRTYTFVD